MKVGKKPDEVLIGVGSGRDCAVLQFQRDEESVQGLAKPGQDIVVSKWIAMEGSSRLAKERAEELSGRYSRRFIKEAERLEECLSILLEEEIAENLGVTVMYELSENGIFGALWEMAADSDIGLEVDLKRIPIRQETVEICNFFDINPYEFKSAGALLMVTDCGEELVNRLSKAGIPASVIGRTTGGNDRVVRYGDKKRFLKPPR